MDGGLCGNGVLDPGEQCDGTNLAGKTCASLGHTGGTLACAGTCQLDESQCFDYPTDWYDLAWHHRRSVTIQAAQVGGNVTNFPVVLTVSDPTLLGKLQSGAQDILITAADGKTKLSDEVELFDAASSTLVVWVSVPALSTTTNTSLYLYYGNATCPDQQDAVHVWDAYDQGVWHLGETATAGGTTAVHADSTGHGHSGAQNGNSDAPGKLGRGQAFDGVSNYINIMTPGSVVIDTADCTISAWVRTSAAAPQGFGLVTKAMGATSVANSKVLAVVSNTKLGFQNTGNAAYSGSGPAVNDGNWHHVVWTQTMVGAAWDFYVDGIHDHFGSLNLTPDGAGFTLRFGSVATGSAYADAFFAGTIDEVRISSTPRSAGWILTSFHNQGNPNAFAVLGPEEGMLTP